MRRRGRVEERRGGEERKRGGEERRRGEEERRRGREEIGLSVYCDVFPVKVSKQSKNPAGI